MEVGERHALDVRVEPPAELGDHALAHRPHHVGLAEAAHAFQQIRAEDGEGNQLQHGDVAPDEDAVHGWFDQPGDRALGDGDGEGKDRPDNEREPVRSQIRNETVEQRVLAAHAMPRASSKRRYSASVRSTFTAVEKRDSTRLRPARAIAFARVGFSTTRRIAWARASGFRGGTNSPVSPSVVSSGIPSRFVPTPGVSPPSASRKEPVSPNPAYEASTARSLPARISGMSCRWPRTKTTSATWRRRAFSFRLSTRGGGAPTSNSRQCGAARCTRVIASSTSSLPRQDRMPTCVISMCSGPNPSSRRIRPPSTWG